MIVALDIGSGSVRAGLVTDDGLVHVVVRPGPLALTAGPMAGIDLMALWLRIEDAVRELAGAAATRSSRIEMLTCTSVRYATVWSSPGGVSAWANLARAHPADVNALQEGMDADAVRRLGGWPTALSLSSRIHSARRWDVEPPRDAVPLSLSAWVLSRLGAEPHVDEASWADARVAEADATWSLPVRRPGEIVGTYNGSIAGTSTWRGALIAVSPPDTVAVLAALGDLRAGDSIAVAGTTTPVVAVAERARAAESPVDDSTAWLPFGDDLVLAERNAARTGEALRALASLVGDVSLAGANDPVAPLGVVRSFLGPTLVPPRRFGERAVRHGIEFGMPFSEARMPALLQSAVEANAWATDAQLRGVELQVAKQGRRIVCGGQTRSRLFLRLLASAGAESVHAVTGEAALLGAASAASGKRLPELPSFDVEPDLEVGDVPLRWVAEWWHRYEDMQEKG